MNTWKLTYNDFIPKEEPLREALTTLGNGYFGTRGAACEAESSEVHYPGTYIAGLYNTLPTNIAGKTIYNEDFVNCPNWLAFRYKINNGSWFHYFEVDFIDYRVELDMYNGILSKFFRFKDSKGNITRVEHQRMVSMADPHLGAFRFTFTPENYSGRITINSGIDGRIVNDGVARYRQLDKKHLDAVDVGEFGSDGIYLLSKTNQSNIMICEAMRTLVFQNGRQYYPELNVIEQDKIYCMHVLVMDVEKGQDYSVEKLFSVYTSRDIGDKDILQESIEKVGRVNSFTELYENHRKKWAELWSCFDVKIEGDDFIQKVLHLHTYHLLQTASHHNKDIDAGMPARGLHGEAYRGHVFWDELYIFGFYNLRAPEITKALLMYRYRRLGAAKAYAAQHGHRGAMYPWQSASTGEETTQIIHLNPLSGTWGPDYSSNQRHVSSTIAFNTWIYYYTTGDIGFLKGYGAEIILEIAHFWASISKYNEETGRYEISGVMGPDEFHEKYPDSEEGGLKNNAYTNIMAVWVIQKALTILNDMLSQDEKDKLLEKTDIDEKDLQQWSDIIHKMTIPLDENGIIHQFDGYMDLKELDWEAYSKKNNKIHRIDRILKAENKSPDHYKVSKQADVLMLFYVLHKDTIKDIFKKCGYKFNKGLFKKNFDYYFPRTSHGSSLSMVVHSYVCSIFKNKNKTLKLLLEAIESDIYDTQGGTTSEGIHTGVMAGTIDVFLRAFAGFDIVEDMICLDPNLLKGWTRIKFKICYKKTWFGIDITQEKIDIKAEPPKDVSKESSDIPVRIKEKVHLLIPGEIYTIYV
jgi:trehalose/maltose hydrolase-like predicted phosphorylase